ncbi:MAG: hypothetical protein VB083_02710 [Aminobacterium sp.]|uniref:hypothetical protein n=1 Tax=Aminobacterium sp. TaxID=1872491 RepID=UPI002B1EEEDF|nr:hypothetical protein [Aminobacterium sp.]MEA4876798.1 hypothetical protein [Aminobacterium sp.]
MSLGKDENVKNAICPKAERIPLLLIGSILIIGLILWMNMADSFGKYIPFGRKCELVHSFVGGFIGMLGAFMTSITKKETKIYGAVFTALGFYWITAASSFSILLDNIWLAGSWVALCAFALFIVLHMYFQKKLEHKKEIREKIKIKRIYRFILIIIVVIVGIESFVLMLMSYFEIVSFDNIQKVDSILFCCLPW